MGGQRFISTAHSNNPRVHAILIEAARSFQARMSGAGGRGRSILFVGGSPPKSPVCWVRTIVEHYPTVACKFSGCPNGEYGTEGCQCLYGPLRERVLSRLVRGSARKIRVGGASFERAAKRFDLSRSCGGPMPQEGRLSLSRSDQYSFVQARHVPPYSPSAGFSPTIRRRSDRAISKKKMGGKLGSTSRQGDRTNGTTRAGTFKAAVLPITRKFHFPVGGLLNSRKRSAAVRDGMRKDFSAISTAPAAFTTDRIKKGRRYRPIDSPE